MPHYEVLPGNGDRKIMLSIMLIDSTYGHVRWMVSYGCVCFFTILSNQIVKEI